MITEQQQFFIELLRKSIGDGEGCPQGDIEEIGFLTQNQMCVPFVYQGAIKAGLTPSEDWKKLSYKIVMRNYKNLQVQDKVVKKLTDAGIKCAVIKGSSVAAFYPEPIWRPLGDVDLLVEEARYEEAIDLLLDGRSRGETHSHSFHCTFKIDDISIEVHRYVTDYTDKVIGNTLKQLFSHALDDVIYETHEGFTFPALSLAHQAVTLLLHTKRHLVGGKVTVRMLLDWAMFAKNVSYEEWEKEVYPVVCSVKQDKLAQALMQVATTYFGMDYGAKQTQTFDKEFIEGLLEMFLESGAILKSVSVGSSIGETYAFYKKEGSTSASAWLKTIDRIATTRYKLYGAKRILKPVFWVYVPLRYGVRVLFGKSEKFSVSDMNEASERKNRIFKEIGYEK